MIRNPVRCNRSHSVTLIAADCMSRVSKLLTYHTITAIRPDG